LRKTGRDRGTERQEDRQRRRRREREKKIEYRILISRDFVYLGQYELKFLGWIKTTRR
jgi:hypothetical protein